MLSLPLGPVALPVAPVVLLLAVWAGAWVASRLYVRAAAPHDDGARRPGSGDAAGHTMLLAAALGLLAARIGHLAANAAAYGESPLWMLDLRDGGWLPLAGLAAAGAWLLWRGWRTPALRRPLAGGASAALLVWVAASLAAGTQAGQPMPAKAFTSLDDGRAVDLRQAAAGRPLVVNLWASWCGPCRFEMPTLAAAQQRERDIGLVFVNQGESPAAVRAYLSRQGLALRAVLLDPASTLGPAVGSRGLPTTLFYDADGRLVDAHFGLLNAPALQARLDALRRTAKAHDAGAAQASPPARATPAAAPTP